MRRFRVLAIAAAGFVGMGAAAPGPATVRAPAILHVGDIALRPPEGLTLCPAAEEDWTTLVIGRSFTACTGEGIPRRGDEDDDGPLPPRIEFHSYSVGTLESPIVSSRSRPFGEVRLFGDVTPLHIIRSRHRVKIGLTAYFNTGREGDRLGQLDIALITTDARLDSDLPVFMTVLETLTDCRGRTSGVCAAPQWTGAAKPS